MPKLKRILIYPDGVTEKQVYPAGWKPTSSTIAYFPFKDDTLDHSGNGTSLSISGSFTKSTLGYVFSSSTSGQGVSITNGDIAYIGLWFKVNSTTNNTTVLNYAKRGYIAYQPTHNNSSLSNRICNFTNSSYTVGGNISGFTYQVWHHLAFLYDGAKLKVAKDGVLQDFYNGTGYNFGNSSTFCGCGSSGNINVNISEVIVENRAWTSEEVSNYYNTTKSNYGL